MSVIPPNNNTTLIVDDFINYATAHLSTVSGIVNTLSLYPPVATALPGVLLWTGYQVQPATPGGGSLQIPIVQDPVVDIIIGDNAYHVELETNPEIIIIYNEERPIFESVRQDIDGGGFGVTVLDLTPVAIVNITPVVKTTPTNEKPKTNYTIPPDISFINPDLDWVGIAMAYMIKKESFTAKATNDEGDPRLGYGTSQLFVSNINGNLITRVVEYGDTTTQENAIIVLEYQVRNTFPSKVYSSKPRLGTVKQNGGKDYTIRPDDWDSLNNGQKAACICYTYNCGSFLYDPNIAEAIRNKDYEAAAIGMENGPTKGKETGMVYPGLVKRRKQEAMIFRLPN
jgi:hypothetical protein